MSKNIGDQLTYEQAYEKLEKLVGELESGNLSLEQSLEIFEECVRLVAYCQKKLDEAERKIELLVSKSADNDKQEEKVLDFAD
jgi:exodeoxyribonuclease VII small subunit